MTLSTGLENVTAALNREKPKHIPTFEWSVHPSVMSGIVGHSDIFRFTEEMDLDGVIIYEDMEKKWINNDSYIDEWGVTQAMAGADYPTAVAYPIKNLEELENIHIPDPHAAHRFETLKQAVRRFKGKRAILFRLRDAYSLPRNLRGMENLMMDYVLQPELVHRLIDISITYYTEMAYHAMEIGADIFWTSDDYCDNRGPTMGPDTWREFILPGLRKLVKIIRHEGSHFIKHNDGNITEILPDMVESGISCIDPIDTGAGMDLERVKGEYGSKIAIKGGVPLDVLVNGTVQEMRRTVAGCIEIAGADGGYICSSASDITGAVKPENYKAMVDTVKETKI